jgi:thiol:disulfide interchange protein DsbC
MKTTRLIAGLFAAVISTVSFAQGSGDPSVAGMATKLKQLYPKTTFNSVSQTPMPGVYEVVMGKNVAYVEETGRYFLFGHLYDMQLQQDLTEGKAAAASSIDFGALPKQDAIVTVKGNGSRKIAVFSDPDCPYCKKFEETLAKITDVTIYTYLFPIDSLHPEARRKSVGVWCAPDRSRAWDDLMLRGKVPNGECESPVQRNVELAAKLGINGTPTIILDSGRLIPGAMPPEQLNGMLKGTK